MNYSLYSIKTLFNTHVGSGQSSYGIVDNIVQKDYLTKYPCVHSTSLKGALREWVEKQLNKIAEAKVIFGDANETKEGKEVQTKANKPGSHHFFQAALLSFPMRSDKVQFFNVTSPKILEEFKCLLNDFGITKFDADLQSLINLNPVKDQPKSLSGTVGAVVESHVIRTIAGNCVLSPELKKILGTNVVIMHNDNFDAIIKKLPIITRNNLENGQSTNLFYEEVVPRETHFAFLVGTDATGSNTFNSIKDETKLVQIGANATVGYGFCKLQQII